MTLKNTIHRLLPLVTIVLLAFAFLPRATATVEPDTVVCVEDHLVLTDLLVTDIVEFTACESIKVQGDSVVTDTGDLTLYVGSWVEFYPGSFEVDGKVTVRFLEPNTGGDCVIDQLVITDMLSTGIDEYKVCETILVQGDSLVTPTGDLTLYAGSWVEFHDGFVIEQDGKATVRILPDLPDMTVSCNGFEHPMDVPVTVRRNRSALPLRATLTDEDGFIVSSADLAAHPVVQVMYDSGIPGEDPVDVTQDVLPVGEMTEGNVFYYMSAPQEWHFNLSARAYTSTGTYTITMESADEEEYTFAPKCEAQFIRQ